MTIDITLFLTSTFIATNIIIVYGVFKAIAVIRDQRDQKDKQSVKLLIDAVSVQSTRLSELNFKVDVLFEEESNKVALIKANAGVYTKPKE